MADNQSWPRFQYELWHDAFGRSVRLPLWLLITLGPPLLDWWFTPQTPSPGQQTTVPLWAWAFYSAITTVVQFTHGVGERVRELEAKLSNRKRAKWIADELGKRLLKTKDFFTHTQDMDANEIRAWEENALTFLSVTPELGPSYVGRFISSANINYGHIPDEFTAHPERKANWYRIKTRGTRLKEFIDEWSAKALSG